MVIITKPENVKPNTKSVACRVTSYVVSQVQRHFYAVKENTI